VFPIFQYDTKKQDVIKHKMPTAIFLGSFVLMIFWAALATTWITPIHVGVAVSILVELHLLLAIIYIVQISQL
jgi:hypothetical protein